KNLCLNKRTDCYLSCVISSMSTYEQKEMQLHRLVDVNGNKRIYYICKLVRLSIDCQNKCDTLAQLDGFGNAESEARIEAARSLNWCWPRSNCSNAWYNALNSGCFSLRNTPRFPCTTRMPSFSAALQTGE